jgi:hypothetical protein
MNDEDWPAAIPYSLMIWIPDHLLSSVDMKGAVEFGDLRWLELHLNSRSQELKVSISNAIVA